MDVDRLALERATARLAAMADDAARWEKSAAPVAYAAWALRESGQAMGREGTWYLEVSDQLYEESARLATSATGSSFLQRAALHLIVESQRGMAERDPVAPRVLQSLRERLQEPGALAKLPIFVMGQTLEAMGRMGDPLPALREALLAKRRAASGSYEDRPWVTAFALTGLVHGRCKEGDIGRTRDWLERQVSGDGSFVDKLGEVPTEVSTAYCLLALLQAESGEDHPPVKAAAHYLQRNLETEARPLPLALSILALRLIDRIEFARIDKLDGHKVVVETHHNYKQEVTHVHGDIVHGGKTQIENSTLVRSNVGGAGGGEGAGRKVVVKDSTLVRSEVAGATADPKTGDVVRRIIPESGPKYCSECGEALAGGAKFCAGCGTPVVRRG